MSDYHVRCGVFAIYAGTLNKEKTMWRNRSECTDEAISAVAQYLLENEKSFKFAYKGERYRMKVEKIDDAGNESES